MFSVLYISELCCCSFLQSTHFFDNWKKQKIILRKSEKETFLKEGDQNSGTGTQPPHPSTKINSQTAIHK